MVATTTTYRSVFAIGQFRALYAGTLTYALGFTFELIGLSVLVYARTGSAFAETLAFGMGFAPQAVGGLLFTSLADLLAPRLVITGGMLLRAVPGVAIGLMPWMPVPAMLALVGLAATVAPVFTAAVSRVLPDVLDGDRYVLGRSVLGLTISGTQIVGTGLGGAILALLPARWLLLLAGCCLIASAFVRVRVAQPVRLRAVAAGTRGAIGATVSGNVRLLADGRVRGLLLAQWLPACCVTGAESLVVPYTESRGHPASAAGLLLAIAPAGMLIGNLVIGRFCAPVTRQRLAFPLAAATGAPLVALVLSPPLPLAGVALFVSGFGFGYELGIQQAFLDSLPADLRGQGFGLNTTGVMSGQGLTPPVTGAVATMLGPALTMAAAGAACVCAVICLRGPLSGRRRLPAEVGAAVDVDDLAGDVTRLG